jgi:formylglycine-generating enzyme required for sulfatase activity
VIKSVNADDKKKALVWKNKSAFCWHHRDTADYFYNKNELDSALKHYGAVVKFNGNDKYCISHIQLCVDKRKVELKNAMYFVQGGNFSMGSKNGPADEQPVHVVRLDGFYIDRNEVTNAEFALFLNVTGITDGEGNEKINLKKPDCKIRYSSGVYTVENGFENSPVSVTWYGASSYAVWVGKSLPSEAQWEYAFTKAAHDAPKLKNMDTSLCEWCEDWYFDNFYNKKEKQRNPLPVEIGKYKVFRGSGEGAAKKSKRDFALPSDCRENIGFRCVMEK